MGAFHRAHMAVYVDDILSFDPAWGIIGASLRNTATRSALAPQDFLYTHIVRSSHKTKLRVIGSVLDVISGSTHHDQLIAALIDPRIRIVSLTVTEKGYCHNPATGLLEHNHPDIRHDLEKANKPLSVPGILVRALELRRQEGVKPFTVLCCDNVPSNGTLVGNITHEFAMLRNADLAQYISGEMAFPSTMVDRIVPATTEEDRQLVFKETGFEDAWPVVTEPFTQWVIEDNFSNGRPDFERVGVQLVKNVKPFELMKLRMLNASHSTLAYLGFLAGYEYVSDAVANPNLQHVIHAMMSQEVMPTLPAELGELNNYRDQLIERFANRSLKHRTTQIATDGSQKLPQRLLGTIRDRLKQGQPINFLTLSVAGWMRYVMGVDEQGRAIEIKDPMRERLRNIADAASGNPQQLVYGLLHVKEIFGEDLPHERVFVDAVTSHLSALLKLGAKAVLAQTRSLP